jgi:hypothetical protein
MAAQKQTYYIPVTMDELMARFVTNMERNDCKKRFIQQKQTICDGNLQDSDAKEIEESVYSSFSALKDLLGNNTIHMER